MCDLHKVSLISDPDMALTFFSNIFNSIADKHAPLKRLQIKCRHSPWFLHELSMQLVRRMLHGQKLGTLGLSRIDFCLGSYKTASYS